MLIKKDFPLNEILWYKIGGKTKYLIEVESKKDILEALQFIKKERIKKVFVTGSGANLIFTDEYFDGAVIRLIPGGKNSMQFLPYGKVEVFGGEILNTLILHSFDHQLTGLEWAGGLPGTVGAGVRGNVGAFGGEIKDTFVSCEVAFFNAPEKGLIKRTKEEMHFSYRTSEVKLEKNSIVVSSTFQLKSGSDEEMTHARERFDANIAYRLQNHPHDHPNTGSVFKNISDPSEVKKILKVYPELREQIENKWHGKVSMGFLNKKLGFSGFQIGKAQVSEKHGNFINNVGGAKAKDVIAVIEAIQEKFEETFGFTPEPEVEIVQ